MKNRFMLQSALTDEGTGAPAGDGEGTQSPADDGGIPEGKEWLKGADLDIIKDPSLQSIPDVATLAKSYVHAQKMVGKDKVVVPDANSSEEDWAAFYRKAGLPESIDTYELSAPEGLYSDEQAAAIKQLAFENNIMPSQMAKILEAQKGFLDERTTTEAEQDQELVEQALAELKEEWGEEGYNANVAKAQTVIEEFAPEGFTEYLEETGLGDDPMMIKLLSKIGENLTEDTFQADSVAHLGVSKEDAESEIASILGNDASPYWNSNHANHERAVKRMAKLQEIMSK